jgi:hypothetical protein
MVVGICAENADLVEVLIAVGWWWVLVSAELVASTENAGVEETGLVFVVVAELGRTAVTPWVAFHVSGVRWSGLCTWCERCVRDGLEVAAGLVLGLIAGLQVWRSVGSQVP